jgi:hypothetical protein
MHGGDERARGDGDDGVEPVHSFVTPPALFPKRSS